MHGTPDSTLGAGARSVYPLISMTLTSPGRVSSSSLTAFASSLAMVSSHLVFTADQRSACSNQKTSSWDRYSSGPFAPLERFTLAIRATR